MEDPPHFSPFQQKVRTGDNPLLILDPEFLKNHTKVLLRSDVSDKVWKVKLDDGRLADGWEEFAGSHKFKDGDVLIFKHDVDEVFHVSVSGYTQNTSSSSEDEDSDDYETDNTSEKKSKKQEAGSSSENTRFITAYVTPYSLLRDRLVIT